MNKRTEAQRLAEWLEDQLHVDTEAEQAADELRRLDAENTALRKCAIKYLQWLNIKNPEAALSSDLLDPEMTE